MMMFSCSREREIEECDLIFVSAGVSEMSEAITKATHRTDTCSFSHVGAIIKFDGEWHVVDASSKTGVSMRLLKDFMNDVKKEDEGLKLILKRAMRDIDEVQTAKNLVERLGAEYDWTFLPDNGKYYCSELIYECFVDEHGDKVFTAKPMNFRDEDGNMPEFWTNLFSCYNMPIPEGVLGTNPNDMAGECVFVKVLE